MGGRSNRSRKPIRGGDLEEQQQTAQGLLAFLLHCMVLYVDNTQPFDKTVMKMYSTGQDFLMAFTFSLGFIIELFRDPPEPCPLLYVLCVSTLINWI